jgi:hypothetical protein
LSVQAVVEGWPPPPGEFSTVPASTRSSAWLFVFWGLLDKDSTEHFWTFVARASEERPTEDLFRTCFGFGYADAERRIAANYSHWLNSDERLVLSKPEQPPNVPPLALRGASSVESGRLPGEWRRNLALLNTNKSDRASELEAVRLSIAKSLRRNEQDARLLASLGLCERSAGRDDEAYSHLTAASRLGVVRPRAYLELARIEYERALRSPESSGTTLSESQARAVLEPLARARSQSPTLEGVYELMCDVWTRSTIRPGAGDLLAMREGTRRFPRNTRLMSAAVKLHNENGEASAAAEIANRWLKATDTRTQKPFQSAITR